jgi:hypothetical protein
MGEVEGAEQTRARLLAAMEDCTVLCHRTRARVRDSGGIAICMRACVSARVCVFVCVCVCVCSFVCPSACLCIVFLGLLPSSSSVFLCESWLLFVPIDQVGRKGCLL